MQVPLFESDLDDNGVSQVSVKLRVMPRAWLLLLRFWLRVDGCMVRLRETRIFCRCVRLRASMNWALGVCCSVFLPCSTPPSSACQCALCTTACCHHALTNNQ